MHSEPTAATGYADLRCALIGMQALLISIAIISCALRTYSRILILSRLGVDDYIMIVATIFSLASSIVGIIGTKFGWGLHFTDVLPDDYPNILLTSWIGQLLFIFSTSAVKVSILIFYLRFATTTGYQRVIYASIVWMLACFVMFVFVSIFQCVPIHDYWTGIHSGDNAHCLDDWPLVITNGIINIFNDFFVYILPMPVLWRLHMPLRQRIGLLVLFSVGSISCIAGAMRVYYSTLTTNGQDTTWIGFPLWTWEAVEVNMGIACACAPAIKPLFVRWFPRIMIFIFGANSAGTANQARAPAGPGAFIHMMDSEIRVERGVTVVRHPWAKNISGRWEEEVSMHTRVGRTLGKDGSSEESLTDHVHIIG